MGVPAFFRWLSKKYPLIVTHCHEEKPIKIPDGETIPVDLSKPNPNEMEFDNLYLDMNGIIHPCCHPENKPAPENEDEMMVDIFAYIDRIMSIVRPRRLLYMAIDGVAPRAKMNQQRSRRFRAAKESTDKKEAIAKVKAEMRQSGMIVPPDKTSSSHFDSNCITPGTEFMFRLADCLRYYVHDRLNNDPGWKNLKVILSDANVPGEGEHKIMAFIRKQRALPSHDANTRHCLCGADADLIMLGLATHEISFTIIREEFKYTQRPCEICSKPGHTMEECTGLEQNEADEQPLEVGDTTFIFIKLPLLREYLAIELKIDNCPFEYSLERTIDDWVFMCFFVGNDFLPHLPSLSIREGAIDRLIGIYKKVVYRTKGYLTENGKVFLDRVQLMLTDLGVMEDEIFQKRKVDDDRFKKRQQQRKLDEQRRKQHQAPSFIPGGQFAPTPARSGSGTVDNPRIQAAEMRTNNMNAAQELRQQMGGKRSVGDDTVSPQGKRQKAEPEEPVDNIRLWEKGWRARYYTNKFGVDEDDDAFRHTVANEYVKGLCWVLLYYYQGCASWEWYYPYHYAPFASDFVNIGDLDTSFRKNTKPFKPLEQLMSVFPAASKKFLPPSWQLLMYEPESPIIDFYPTNFKIDLNGKTAAWMGVALLPYVDEVRLHEALQSVYPDITDIERSRNTLGTDRLFVSKNSEAYSFLQSLYEGGSQKENIELPPELTEGMTGLVSCDEFAIEEQGTFKSPIKLCPDLPANRTMTAAYEDPQFDSDHIFPSTLLPKAVIPPQTITEADYKAGQSANRGPIRGGFNVARGGQRRGGYNTQAMERHIQHSLGGRGGGGGYGYRQDNQRGGRQQGMEVGPPNFYKNQSDSGYGRDGQMRHRSEPYRGGYQGGRDQHSRTNSYPQTDSYRGGRRDGNSYNNRSQPYDRQGGNQYNNRQGGGGNSYNDRQGSNQYSSSNPYSRQDQYQQYPPAPRQSYPVPNPRGGRQSGYSGYSRGGYK